MAHNIETVRAAAAAVRVFAGRLVLVNAVHFPLRAMYHTGGADLPIEFSTVDLARAISAPI
jgi:hypothetical protein